MTKRPPHPPNSSTGRARLSRRREGSDVSTIADAEGGRCRDTAYPLTPEKPSTKAHAAPPPTAGANPTTRPGSPGAGAPDVGRCPPKGLLTAFHGSAATPRAALIGTDPVITQHILRALASDNIPVALLLPPDSPASQPREHDLLRTFRPETADILSFRKAAKSVDLIISVATGSNRRVAPAASGQPLPPLAQLALSSSASRVIHISTVATLGLGSGKGPVRDHDPLPLEQFAGYDEDLSALARWELTLLTAHEELGLPVTILRPGIVVGPGTPQLPIEVGTLRGPRQCLGWSNGHTPLPFVLIQDLVSACLKAIRADNIAGECFNLAGDVRLTAREYVAALSNVVGHPIAYRPRSPAHIYADHLRGYAVARLSGRASPIPSLRTLRARATPRYVDSGRAKALLEWTPVADQPTFVRQAFDSHASHRRSGCE